MRRIGIRASVALAAMLLGTLSAAHAATILTNSSGVIRNSLCVGADCPNNPAFGFTTLLMMENNLRIKAQDTSSTASFPTQDWQITFNDSANGGANKFSIESVAPDAHTPFTIMAGARTNALFVDSQGDVGIGTSTPVGDLHIRVGNTPTLRLDQDSSAGFTPQTWDVAGNETNFFVRDVTHGSKLPFKIRPDAATNSIVIDPQGDVGFGTSSPAADTAVHVRRTNETARILVEEASGTTTIRPLFTMINNGPAQFQMQNSDSGVDWDFRTNNSDDFTINNPGGLGLALRIDQGTGDAFLTGGVQITSSRALKEDFTALDPLAILDLVGSLPLTSWSYKRDAGGTRHIGPMAEDFHAAFGVGADDRHLSLADVSGVALAAIQGLQQAGERKDARIAELEARLAVLEATLGVGQ